MNYTKHYERLIERAQHRSMMPGIYFEKHHVIPRCMGGTDVSENIVKLLPEEHYVAHQLLVKIYPDEPKIILAARYMTNGNKKNGGRTNNKLYSWIKRKFSQAMRDINLGKKQTVETVEKRANTLRGRINGPLSPESIRKRTETRKLRGSGKHRKPRSTETKHKLSIANKGKILSDEHKRKVSIGLSLLPDLICPHCSKVGRGGAMHYWHFDNCKVITHMPK